MANPSRQFEYHCPGEASAISRAVHLARLADGYPACRRCPHRGDTEGLSSRLKRLAARACNAHAPAEWFHEEGAGGRLHEGFNRELAGGLAAAFGICLRDSLAEGRANPSVALAGDGRACTRDLLAGAAERLQWAACDVVELGSATSPALAWAVAESRADGGFYLGNPGGRTHAADVKFFLSRGRPISVGGELAAIRRAVEQTPRRPARRRGNVLAQGGISSYLERFVESFHGLRPLDFRLTTTCRPFAAAVDRLLENTACRAVHVEASDEPERLPAGSRPHFAILVDDDGERCRVWDERGEPLPFHRLALLIAAVVIQSDPLRQTVVIDQNLFAAVAAGLAALGARPVPCGHLRAQIHENMARQQAALGIDSAGRIWYEADGHAAADALATLALLLGRLSRDDRPLSEVLDGELSGH